MAEKPGFDTAVEKWERPPIVKHDVWIIRLKDDTFWWGIAHHVGGGQVYKWHGPHRGTTEARVDMDHAKKTAKAKRRWPLDHC